MLKALRRVVDDNKNTSICRNDLCEHFIQTSIEIENKLIAVLQRFPNETISDADLDIIMSKTDKFLEEAELRRRELKKSKLYKRFDERIISLRQLAKKYPAMIKRHNAAVKNRQALKSRAV